MNTVEDAYVIQGGKPLKGFVQLSGAKNVALKTVIAALLFSGPVELQNVPDIRDIGELIHLIELLGGSAKGKNGSLHIDGTTVNTHQVDMLHGSKIRTSFLLFAPLLYRFGKASIPNPGGCRIGARPIDRIVNGMKKLGVEVTYQTETGYYNATLANKPKGDYVFEKPSHTGTEFMIMLSVFCEGTTRIENAALEPEIDDLIAFLNEGGAQIKREGTAIVVTGVKELVQKKPYRIMTDRNEAVTYAVLGLITGGDVTVSPVPDNEFMTFVNAVKEVGGGVEKTENGWRFFAKGPLTASQITTDAHPGFMTDWQPNWAVLMTQAQGVSTIHERVFENRFAYVCELQKLGARIEFDMSKIENPKDYYFFNYNETKEYKQAIKIFGPQKLHSGVLTVSDLRAGATLAIAALLTPGESVVNGVSIMERGYEKFVEKVINLGGNIKRV